MLLLTSIPSTTLDSNVPLWGFVGGMEEMLNRLRNPATRAKLREESNASHVGRWGDIYISYVESAKNAWTVGKSIAEIAELRGVVPAVYHDGLGRQCGFFGLSWPSPSKVVWNLPEGYSPLLPGQGTDQGKHVG